MPLENEKLLGLYRKMLLVRKMEEKHGVFWRKEESS